MDRGRAHRPSPFTLMKVQIQVSDEQGTVAQKEFTVRAGDFGALQKTLEEAISFLRRESQQAVRRGEPLADLEGPPLYPERPARPSTLTVMDTLQGLLETDFKHDWFTSQEVQHSFRQVHGPISLSTVSTYLARLYRAGALERNGNRRKWTYRLASGPVPGGAREVTLL